MAFADDAAFRIAPYEREDFVIPVSCDVENLQVSNKAFGAYYVATVTWTAGEEAFEWVNGGLDQPLTEADAAAAIACFQAGVAFTMEGSGLVDAEKATNKLPCAEGQPLAENDDVRAAGEWGDSKLCWAGSLSDMLQVTGWGARAINPETGVAFASEDELFSYFTANFTNGGCYQSDGTVWFFTGRYERDVGMASLRNEPSGGLLPDHEPPVTRSLGVDVGEAYAGQLDEMLLTLGEGACIGLDVQMYEQMYPLKADENEMASFDYDRKAYRWAEFHFCEPDEVLQELPFVMNGIGDVILVTDAGNDQYVDDQGNAYPAAQVMVGRFASNQGGLYPTTSEENNENDRFYNIYYTLTEDDLQMDAAISSYAGSHALTAIGTIRCTAGANPGLRALIIIDSDNNAHYYSPVGDGVLKQDRPNIYTMYFVETCTLEDYTTIALSNYIGRKAPISGVTLMTFVGD